MSPIIDKPWYEELWELAKRIEKEKLNLFSLSSIVSPYVNLAKNKGEVAKRKRDVLELLVEASREQAQNAIRGPRELLNLIMKYYRDAHYGTIYVEAELIGRGLFGASEIFGSTLFEVGMHFDPYLSLPVIPASSIKGAVKAIYENRFPRGTEEIGKLFGSKDEQGTCIFTDAYPVRLGEHGYLLYPDVMTAHYKGDMLGELGVEPTPIPYISVAPGTTFGFVIAMKKIGSELRKLREALLLALGAGLGAKTIIGYGTFMVNKLIIEGF